MKAWMKREQWFGWIAAAVVVTMVLAGIGYLIGLWLELPVSAAPSKTPVPPPTPHGHILPPLPDPAR
jgi:hypothetical protein